MGIENNKSVRDYHESWETMKESWNYWKFIRIHNEIARSRWWYDYISDYPDEQFSSQNLELGFKSNLYCQTIRQYALAVYNNEQAYDDLASKYKWPITLDTWWYFD